jgi:general secretion pathway protein G
MKEKTRALLAGPERDAGYTLLELLVVLGILGLLAVIATPQVLKYLDNARLGTAKTEIGNLSLAADLYRLDVGRYPTTEEGLTALLVAPPDVESWNGPYLTRGAKLTDPWGQAYRYRSPGEHGDFDIFSYGPAGTEGSHAGDPLVKNW